MQKRFPQGHWSFVGPESEEKWNGTHTYKTEGLWNRSADVIVLHLREWTSYLSSNKCVGPRISEKQERNIIDQHNCDLSTAELFFGTIISVNQLSVHGAISDWCEDLAQQISDHSFSSTVRPVANMNEESNCRVSPDVMSISTNPLSTNVPVQGNLLHRHNL